MHEVIIRCAEVADAEALLQIYAPYVERTAITYEYDVPSLEDFRGRIRATLQHYPYLVAEVDGVIVGYAYAGVFKARRAYDCSVETSIYVQMDRHRSGVGRRLYAALEQDLSAMDVTNLYACIAYTQVEDEYLTNDSVRFHESMGYSLCGTFRGCAVKFGRRYDMVWMEKHIGAK